MRVGIIGTGDMGSEHLKAWNKLGVEVSACLKHSSSSKLPAFRESGIPDFTEFEDFIRNVDIVDICVPTDLHASFVDLSARAERSIVCEKPLARTLSEACGMVRICKQNNVRLFPAHVVRFFPEYKNARDMVMQGNLGRAAVVRLSRESHSPKKDGENWLLDSTRSGGLILDFMFHDFDFALWAFGPVRTVFAKSTAVSNPDVRSDHVLAVLEHEGGTLTHIQGSWALPYPEFRTGFEIAWTDRLLKFDSTDSSPLRMHLKPSGESGREESPISSPVSRSPYETELACFYSALVHGTDVPVSPEDAIESLGVTLAAIESTQSGKVINVKEFTEEIK